MIVLAHDHLVSLSGVGCPVACHVSFLRVKGDLLAVGGVGGKREASGGAGGGDVVVSLDPDAGAFDGTTVFVFDYAPDFDRGQGCELNCELREVVFFEL